jgi:hypothetical protein
MTTNEILMEFLRDKEIYPHSVLDPHYSDHPAMTRARIIDKTLREMSLLLPSEKYCQSIPEAAHVLTIIAELRRRLPNGKIKTCGAFKHLKAACCAPCHTSRPHTDMNLIELPDGSKAWVCSAVEWAIYPERYAEFMERRRDCPAGKLLRGLFAGDDRKEN